MESIPKMLKIKDVSKETGLSYDYIRKLCITNQIVYIKAGNKYFINMEKFIDFLNGESR